RALREAWFGLAPVQQQASSVAVAEEGGQAERGEAVGGVLLHQLAVRGKKLDDAGVGAQRAGFEEVRRTAAEQQRREFGMAGIDGPEYGAGAFGRPRVGKSRVGGEQRADLLCVALANGVKDHASVSGRRQGGAYRILRKSQFTVGQTPMSLGLSNFHLPFGVSGGESVPW